MVPPQILSWQLHAFNYMQGCWACYIAIYTTIGKPQTRSKSCNTRRLWMFLIAAVCKLIAQGFACQKHIQKQILWEAETHGDMADKSLSEKVELVSQCLDVSPTLSGLGGSR